MSEIPIRIDKELRRQMEEYYKKQLDLINALPVTHRMRLLEQMKIDFSRPSEAGINYAPPDVIGLSRTAYVELPFEPDMFNENAFNDISTIELIDRLEEVEKNRVVIIAKMVNAAPRYIPDIDTLSFDLIVAICENV